MNFDERNAAWTGNWREFRQVNSRGGTRVWKVGVVGNTIHYEWGILNGAMQRAHDVLQGVNIGKKNEMSPEAYAIDRARELCRKKHWEGYREFGPEGLPLDPLVETSIDFENLPLSLCFYKPDNTLGAGMMKKAREKKVLYTRKRNGLAYVISRGTGMPNLYSRKMLRQSDNETKTELTWDDRFPHIIQAAAQVMPENSILLGELVMDRDGADDMAHVQSIMQSLTAQSLADQATYGRPSFYIWDVAFWAGQDLVSKVPVAERYHLIHELDYSNLGQALLPIEIYPAEFLGSPEEALEFCKYKKWEGWVAVDPEGIYGDRAYNFKGKPDRPGSVCGKHKPEYEDDFIAIYNPEAGIGERSTKGRYGGGIKNVALYQYNTKGELVFIANVASGLEEQQRIEWGREPFRQVWKVLYTDRRYMSEGDKTNAIDFPRFDSVRTDKTPEECVNPRL